MNSTKLEAILGCGGSGKLITNDTLVLTPDGFIKNKDLVLGEEVICEDGTPTKILNIWEGKNVNIYRVSFHDNTYIDACEDHLWKVQTSKMRQTNSTYKVLNTKTLLKDFKYKNSVNGYKYSIPLCSPVFFKKQILPLHPYLLGYLLGNGSLHNQIKVSCHQNDVLEIKNKFDKLLPSNVNSVLWTTPVGTLSAGFRLSFKIKDILKDLGLLFSYSNDKFIPYIYLHSCIEDRLEILKGLMDSDGSISLKKSGVRSINFSTSSLQLLKDVSFLIRSLGGISVEKTYNRQEKGIEYQLHIRIDKNIFSLQRKEELFNKSKQGHLLNKKIIDIKYLGKQDGRCIRVENKLHTYVVENFVVTHNSYYINSLIKEDKFYALRTATTGIAALNLGTVRGADEPTTINSALRYFNAESLLRNFHQGKTILPLKMIDKKYKSIIIDEISMMDSGTLDLIVLALDQYNNTFNKQLNLLISGDIGQLAPVNGSPIFTAKCWPRFNIKYLTEVKRQENKEFVEALNLIRKGKAEEALPWFKDNIEFRPSINLNHRGITLFSTNNEVDIHNRKCLDRLLGESKSYYAKSEGVAHPTWKDIPKRLEVKPGCIIQLLYNSLEQGFANGDAAIVNEVWDNALHISLLRKKKEIFLRPRKLENFEFDSNGHAKKTPVGTLTVIHAKLMFSATNHKIQGLTLDDVQINLKGEGRNFLSRQSGMLYTSLSRVRTPEGLTIVGTPEDLVKCCYVNPNYLKWIK